MPVKKLWPKGRKCFAHVETFLNKMEKPYSHCPETKKEKNFPPEIIKKSFLDTRRAVGKSSLQKFLLKSVNCFSENRKKPQNFKMLFTFCFFSKLILWTFRMHLSQFYPKHLEVGLVFRACIFFNKRTKNCRSWSEKFEKVSNFFCKKNIFVKKCPIELQVWQLRWRFLAKRLKKFSSKYRNPWEKRFFSNYSLRRRESQLWISHRDFFVERQKISRSVFDKVSK